MRRRGYGALALVTAATLVLAGCGAESGETEQMFSMPKDKRTEDYITGRFG